MEERLGEGDFTLEKLFKEYYPRLCFFAFQILANKEEAEDVSQEAFITFWNNRESLAIPPAAVKKFLYSSVRNACLNKLRHEKVVQKYLSLQNSDPIDDKIAITSIIRAEVIDELYRVISTLPGNCQRVFRLGYLEGLSNPKIAEELGVSINTVKTQKQRGLQLLRMRLDPELFIILVLLNIR